MLLSFLFVNVKIIKSKIDKKVSIIDMIILSFSKSPSLHQVENKHKIIMEEINLNERF